MCEKHTTGTGPYATQIGALFEALKHINPHAVIQVAGHTAYIDAGTLPASVARLVVQSEVCLWHAEHAPRADGTRDALEMLDADGAAMSVLISAPEDGVTDWTHEVLRDTLHLAYWPTGPIAPVFQVGYRLFPKGHPQEGAVNIVYYAHVEDASAYQVPEDLQLGDLPTRLMMALKAESLRALPQKEVAGNLLLREIRIEAGLASSVYQRGADAVPITALMRGDGSKVPLLDLTCCGKEQPFTLYHPLSVRLDEEVRRALHDADKPSNKLFRETFTWGVREYGDGSIGFVFVCLAAEKNVMPSPETVKLAPPPAPLWGTDEGVLARKKCPACSR